LSFSSSAARLEGDEEPSSRKGGSDEDARAAYDRALKLVHSDAERRFLERPLAKLQG